MTSKRGAAALAALFLCMPAFAMTAAEFLAKADVVKARGMRAMFSSDLRLLRAEFNQGVKAWRAQARQPVSCPPEKLQLKPAEIYALMAAVPPGERPTTDAHDAIVAGLNRKYPCR